MTEQREPGSQHPARPRTAAGRRMLRVLADAHPEPRENREWERKQVLAIEAEASICPNPLVHEWVLPEKQYGQAAASAPTPAEPLDVPTLAEAIRLWYLIHGPNPVTGSYDQPQPAFVAAQYNRLAAARPEADHD